jgi:hypothetical protein
VSFTAILFFSTNGVPLGVRAFDDFFFVPLEPSLFPVVDFVFVFVFVFFPFSSPVFARRSPSDAFARTVTRTRPAVARAGRGVAPIGIGDAKALDDEPSAGCARAMRAHDDAEDDAGSALRIAATAVTFAAANMSRASANAGAPDLEGFNVDSVEISTRRFAARMNER